MRPIDLKRDERHMLPRWMPSQLALGLNHVESGKINAKVGGVSAERLAEVYRDIGSEHLGILEDTLSYGFSTACISSLELQSLAKRIEVARISAGRASNELASALAEADGAIPVGHVLYNEAFNRSVAWLRSRLRYNNRDVLAWIDLGYLNTLRGNMEGARRNIMTASSLSPESSFIIRSSGRFLVHDDDEEAALDITRKALKLGRNPDLIGTEIALADLVGVSSKWAMTARSMVSKINNYGEDRMAETAIALATVEAKHGSRHKLKKILSKDWVAVDENVQAQLMWVSNFSDVIVPKEFSVKGNISESIFRESYVSQDFKKALAAAEGWLEYQPFSTAPATYGSYIAGTYLGDYSKGSEICEAALYSNPSDFCLLNNAASCFARAGNLDKARAYLNVARRIVVELTKTEDAVLKATNGLIAYRTGELALGASLYQEAIRYFEKNELKKEEHLATLMWAEEAAASGNKSIAVVLEKIENLIDNDPHENMKESYKELRDSLRKIYSQSIAS